ncbi:MAG: transposase [Candidatus Bathyarchaeota archaeon]
MDITNRVTGWLWPEYMRGLQRIRAADVVNVNETGARVDGRRHWIWVFTTLTDTLIVVRRSGGKKALEEILGKDFRGVIVCDGRRSYPASKQVYRQESG